MLEITRGYKVGRAVLFYDLTDVIEGNTMERVTKDEVVKQCGDGMISNAKIQWWEGKAIVRCSNKNLPLVKMNDTGEVLGNAQRRVRGTETKSKTSSRSRASREDADRVVCNTKVVGKLNKKKYKRDTSFAPYCNEEIRAGEPIDTSKFRNIEELFESIAKDFRVSETERYKAEFDKRFSIKKELHSMTNTQIKVLCNSIAIYLMNMAYDELSEVYAKYM